MHKAIEFDLSRRSFLRGTLALAGTVALQPAFTLLSVPKIWADGIHDDAPGLNALFARQPVEVVDDAVSILQGEHISLRNGIYRIGSTLFVRDHTYISGITVKAAPEFSGDYLINAKGEFNSVVNSIFWSNRYQPSHPLLQVYPPNSAS
jgi:hypothetical protein